MIAVAPDGARCKGHPGVAAQWTCRRCGSFMCVECERRVRPDALPLCPDCWALRGQRVAPPPDKAEALANPGLVLGIIALLPIIPVQIAALVINLVALARGSRSRKVIAGLSLTIVGFAVTALVLIVAIAGG